MKRGAGELFATHRVILIEHVIDPMDDGFSLDDIYHALDIIAEHQDAIDEFCMRQIPLNGCVREAGCCLYLRHTLSFLLQLQNHITDWRGKAGGGVDIFIERKDSVRLSFEHLAKWHCVFGTFLNAND